MVARAVKEAAEGTVVVTAEVRERLPAALPWEISDLGTRALRGIDAPRRLYRIAAPADDNDDNDNDGGDGGRGGVRR